MRANPPQSRRTPRLLWLCLGLSLLILAACGSGPAAPIPEPAAATPTDTPTDMPTDISPTATGETNTGETNTGETNTDETASTSTETTVAEPVAAPSATAESAGDAATVLEFWTSDTEPVRIVVYEAVAQRFMAQYPAYEVRIVPVEESEVFRALIQAAQESTLPALVRVGVEHLAPLAAAGIVDAQAAESVIETVGTDDFRARPLEMVRDPASGAPLGVPFDGWLQAIWYRTDLFGQAGLSAPITWDQIDAACDALPASGDVAHALTLGSAADQNYVHQIFEQIAISNDAWPFALDGTVTFDTPAMIEALRFYTALQRCAPTGSQDLFAARTNYQTGDAAMLFYSTYVMDDLVEGSETPDGRRVEVAVDDLAGKTSFAASIAGPNGAAAYGQLDTLAITQGAPPATVDLAAFFLTEGYFDILALAPLGKIPVLESAVPGWQQLSPVFAAYSPATLGHITNGYDTMRRWALRRDYSAGIRAQVGEIEGRLLIPQVVHAIAVTGEMTPESGAAWLQAQAEALVDGGGEQ